MTAMMVLGILALLILGPSTPFIGIVILVGIVGVLQRLGGAETK